MGEEWVMAWTLGVGVASAGYAVFDRSRFGPSLALIMLACFMFSYSIVFINGDEPLYWFFNAPPWFVSRIVLVSSSMIALMGLWRVNLRRLTSDPRLVALALIPVIIVPVTLLNIAVGNLSHIRVPWHVVLIFSFLLSLTLCMPFALAFPLTQRVDTEATTGLAVSMSVVLCAVIAILGFMEVVLDVGAVRNMFIPGVVETRGSSSFLNPNWFAIGLVPFFFLSLLLSLNGGRWSALSLSALSALGMVSASSRSVVTILLVSLLVFVLCGIFSGSQTRREILRTVGMTIAGCVLGVTAGLFAALALGETAWDRFVTLLIRLALWPLLVFSQTAVFQSIFGRFDITTLFWPREDLAVLTEAPLDFVVGADQVDSAYLFLAATNLPVLLLVVLFFSLLTYLVVQKWRLRRTATSSLNIAALTFIVLAGFVAQVYWAFPVWIVIVVMLTWVLAQLRVTTFAGGGGMP